MIQGPHVVGTHLPLLCAAFCCLLLAPSFLFCHTCTCPSTCSRFFYYCFAPPALHPLAGLTYISSGIPTDEACRLQARAEAAKGNWAFEDVTGSMALLERLVNGDWDAADFLVVPPGASIQVNLGDGIVEAL